MSRLIFEAAPVRRLVEHTIANPQRAIADWSTANEGNGWTPVTSVPTEPHVVLVHDEGVYLMTNGKRERESVHSFVAYAAGCDPEHDSDWYDTAHGLVGGDDFAEHLEWARAIKQMLDDGATHIVIEVEGDGLALDAIMPPTVRPQ